jgi:hypothetical protein
MAMRLRHVIVAICLVSAALLPPQVRALGPAPRDLPDRLSDQEFWQLAESISEPDGTFRSDNVLSNEMVFARLVPEFLRHVRTGGVYLGVGPEQNFTYIHAMRARMAFITDIRRENLHLHLMYKAVFELSADRAEFLSRLFNKPRPAGLSKTASIAQITDAFWNVPTAGEDAHAANLQAIVRHLTKARAIPLPQTDLDGIARVYRAFHWYGPQMNYSASLDLTPLSGGRAATYFDLMTQTGDGGAALAYLGTDEAFAYVKQLQARNLVVPVVGNFGGPKAIRAIGAWVRDRGATIGAFYVSSVEPYLKRAGTFETFCASVATLPVDDRSVFVRPGNLANLRLSAPAVAPPDASAPNLGTYQIGVIVPVVGGCR